MQLQSWYFLAIGAGKPRARNFKKAQKNVDAKGFSKHLQHMPLCVCFIKAQKEHESTNGDTLYKAKKRDFSKVTKFA
jgi:hypothetical protein